MSRMPASPTAELAKPGPRQETPEHRHSAAWAPDEQARPPAQAGEGRVSASPCPQHECAATESVNSALPQPATPDRQTLLGVGAVCALEVAASTCEGTAGHRPTLPGAARAQTRRADASHPSSPWDCVHVQPAAGLPPSWTRDRRLFAASERPMGRPTGRSRERARPPATPSHCGPVAPLPSADADAHSSLAALHALQHTVLLHDWCAKGTRRPRPTTWPVSADNRPIGPTTAEAQPSGLRRAKRAVRHVPDTLHLTRYARRSTSHKPPERQWIRCRFVSERRLD